MADIETELAASVRYTRDEVLVLNVSNDCVSPIIERTKGEDCLRMGFGRRHFRERVRPKPCL